MDATDNQKWAIVNAAKNWYDAPQLKDLRLRWARINFYNLPVMSKAEASATIEMLNQWSPDMTAMRNFFVMWLAKVEA